MTRKTILSALLFIFGTLTFFLWVDNKYEEANAMTVCVVNGTSKGLSKNTVGYTFEVDGINYSAFTQGIRGDDAETSDKYIVVFDSLNPDNNSIVYEIPYSGDYQLDSLRMCCKPQDLISSWEY